MKELIVSVGTTATEILDMNPSRKAYILQNQHATVDVYLGITKNVATTGTRTGRILAAGVSERIKKKNYPELITQELYGIASETVQVWVWTE